MSFGVKCSYKRHFCGAISCVQHAVVCVSVSVRVVVTPIFISCPTLERVVLLIYILLTSVRLNCCEALLALQPVAISACRWRGEGWLVQRLDQKIRARDVFTEVALC